MEFPVKPPNLQFGETLAYDYYFGVTYTSKSDWERKNGMNYAFDCFLCSSVLDQNQKISILPDHA
ncbi:hypothetical protein WG66_003461 [Moniliophthora roreri]|nr:hypothetical protein WG66_003461 [Moniliophthora roreri]